MPVDSNFLALQRQAFRIRLKSLNLAKNEPTLREISAATGLSTSALSNYFNGRIPKNEVIKKALADFYGVSVDELFNVDSVEFVHESPLSPKVAPDVYSNTLKALNYHLEEIYKIAVNSDADTRGWILSQVRLHLSLSQLERLKANAGVAFGAEAQLVAESKGKYEQAKIQKIKDSHLTLTETPNYRPRISAHPPSAKVAPIVRSDSRQVNVRQLAAAAGGGAEVLDETVVGQVSFRETWLNRRGLNPEHCDVIGTMGESMEPTLPEGCSILINRAQRKRQDGRIYVVRTSDGLVVKRAGKGEDGGWQLISDHPAYEPLPWPDDCEVIGQVVWGAQSFFEQILEPKTKHENS